MRRLRCNSLEMVFIWRPALTEVPEMVTDRLVSTVEVA